MGNGVLLRLYNLERDYYKECTKWYAPFWKNGIAVDVISMDDDFSKYDLIIAPFLYMLKDGVDKKIEDYVYNGGKFISTFLTGIVDKDDLCHLGGFPCGNLKEVFGIWAEETDSLPKGVENAVEFNGHYYKAINFCDIIHAENAEVLAHYKSDFYYDTPAVTKNNYGKGTAYYVAFCDKGRFSKEFIEEIIKEYDIKADTEIKADSGVSIRKRGNVIFIMNFSDGVAKVTLDREYLDIVNGTSVSGEVTINECGYLVLE